MINITKLTSKTNVTDHIFVDLNLDFQEKQVSGNFRSVDVAPGQDLVVDYDVEAIKNSIRNILLQKRYTSDLFVNLKGYIGENMSEGNAYFLGKDIEQALIVYEPRVTVNKIYVSANMDQGTYFVSMILKINNINQIVTLNMGLEKSGVLYFSKNETYVSFKPSNNFYTS